MTCERCQAEIPVGRDESCWFCVEPLCYRCWDDIGHCGHPEADMLNHASAAGLLTDMTISEAIARATAGSR